MSARLPDPGEGCWRAIGVDGDRSCPELARVIHCFRCPVYGRAAEGLFERDAPPGYVDGSTSALAPAPLGEAEQDARLLVFRLGPEWLGLPAASCSFVAPATRTRALAGRTNEVFRGLLVHRGELLLSMSLRGLFGMPLVEGKLLVGATVGGNRWVFDADEVQGVAPYGPAARLSSPTHGLEQATSFLSAVVRLAEHDVGLLDVDVLDVAFRRSLRR